MEVDTRLSSASRPEYTANGGGCPSEKSYKYTITRGLAAGDGHQFVEPGVGAQGRQPPVVSYVEPFVRPQLDGPAQVLERLVLLTHRRVGAGDVVLGLFLERVGRRHEAK